MFTIIQYVHEPQNDHHQNFCTVRRIISYNFGAEIFPTKKCSNRRFFKRRPVLFTKRFLNHHLVDFRGNFVIKLVEKLD